MRFFLLILLLPSLATAADPALLVLEHNCVECHNSHDKKGDVALDQYPLTIDDKNLILDVVSGPDPEMPPKRDPLAATDVAAVQTDSRSPSSGSGR